MNEQYPSVDGSESATDMPPNPEVLPRHRLIVLPEQLGYVESADMEVIKAVLIEALSHDDPAYPKLLGEYRSKGMKVVDTLPRDQNLAGQIGLNIAVANLYREAGWYGTALDEYYDAYVHAANSATTHDGLDKVARLLYDASGAAPDKADLTNACRGHCQLSEQAFEPLEGEAALQYALMQLEESGIADATAFLRQRGILQ